MSVNLAAVLQTVKAQLVAAGFTVAARVPEVQASFVLFQSADVTRARSAFNLLNTLGVWQPILTLLLLAGGVHAAKDHRWALVGVGVGVAGSMVVLALGLAALRAVYLDAGAVLTGPSATAVGTRKGLTRAIGWLLALLAVLAVIELLGRPPTPGAVQFISSG